MSPGTSLRYACLAILYAVTSACAQQATSTTLVSVTQTTTVHVTATDYENACQNFYGACVVYGTGAAADYTTTVYQYAPTTSPSPSTALVTQTTTFLATTTASNSDACNNFNGACVVYGGGGEAASSTVYYAGSGSDDANEHAGLGNEDGYIAAQGNDDGGDGQIGGTAGATGLRRSMSEAAVGVGLAVGVAALLI